MASLLDEFSLLTKTLNQEGVDYAICGGLALTLHGFVRGTLDIDLLIRADELDNAWSIANRLGYDVEGLPLHFSDGIIEIRRLSKVDRESKTLFTIDFLLVTSALTQIWDSRESVEWEEGKVWVVSRKGLIELKTISGRPQDLVDIERLENETS